MKIPFPIKLFAIILLQIVVIPSSFVHLYCQVKAWEGTITIPTYGWEDDVNPKFWAMESGAKGATTVKASITYPYNMQDHLSRKLEDVTYKAIFLENEYLKITCLPELGGRLHSIYDKTTGHEAFHNNNVIKPSMIAMRGAFISGGIEWNAGPQVHTVTILSPVDVLYGENEDGSAYIEVSNLEKSLRTRWTVRITLHSGKAVLDENIRIYNPTDTMNPFYFWNCTAFPQRKGTRFIYPMSKGTDHFGVKYFDWPVNDGVDLSWTKNYKDAIHVLELACINPVPIKRRNHLVQYQLAYLNHLIGDDSMADNYLKKAATNYSDLINASRPEMENTLLYALKIHPDDALASYQLGNLYANFGRLEEAEKFWNKAVAANPSMSIPWRNLGLYYWVVKNNHEKPEYCYRNAINDRPYDQT
ncbi:MAG: DUF5107 domain-containing protein, partial [Bacteroidales bacterium]|nr:DUF5107 domain-containing protein [Bacteroidales bacterium]